MYNMLIYIYLYIDFIIKLLDIRIYIKNYSE